MDQLVLETPFEARVSAEEVAREKLMELYEDIEDFYDVEGDDEEEWMMSGDIYEAAEINVRNARALKAWIADFPRESASKFALGKGNWDELSVLFSTFLTALNAIDSSHEINSAELIGADHDTRTHIEKPAAQEYVEAVGREMFDTVIALSRDVEDWSLNHQIRKTRSW